MKNDAYGDDANMYIGPQYTADNVFNLATMQPYGLPQLYNDFTALSKDVVLYLPRTSDLNELAVYAEKHPRNPELEERRVTVTHFCIRGVSKALCVYYGDFA